MKIKWTGDQDEITILGTTFQKGKPVVLDPEKDARVIRKCGNVPGFEEVKTRKAKK